eukprot:521529-Rhodomonas_salina.1
MLVDDLTPTELGVPEPQSKAFKTIEYTEVFAGVFCYARAMGCAVLRYSARWYQGSILQSAFLSCQRVASYLWSYVFAATRLVLRLCCYALGTRWPGLLCAVRYCHSVRSFSAYAMSGTDLALRCAMSGTDLGYGPTRSYGEKWLSTPTISHQRVAGAAQKKEAGLGGRLRCHTLSSYAFRVAHAILHAISRHSALPVVTDRRGQSATGCYQLASTLVLRIAQVPAYAIGLRTSYVVSGTDTAYGASRGMMGGVRRGRAPSQGVGCLFIGMRGCGAERRGGTGVCAAGWGGVGCCLGRAGSVLRVC